MEDKISLVELFTNINRWLEYAEKKNAYIFSFFSLMVIFIPFIEKFTPIRCLLKISIFCFYIGYLFSLFFTVLSIFPITDVSKRIITHGQNKKLKEEDNLLFYGDICKYSLEEYRQKLIQKYNWQLDDSKLNDDLIEQIIMNSTITSNKLFCFKFSVIFTIISVAEFTICFAINSIL
jgi:hypothetical protein